MAVPKRRTSKARQRSRAAHYKAFAPELGVCPQCHSPKLPHHVCPVCGSYGGREVIEIKPPKKKGG